MRFLQNQIIEEGAQDILEKMEKWEKSIKGERGGGGGGGGGGDVYRREESKH